MGRKKMKIGKESTFTAVLHREDDMYVAHCEEIGTVSQGKTIEKALKNLKEATELYLEAAAEMKGAKVEVSRPIMTTFTVFKNAKTPNAVWA